MPSVGAVVEVNNGEDKSVDRSHISSRTSLDPQNGDRPWQEIANLILPSTHIFQDYNHFNVKDSFILTVFKIAFYIPRIIIEYTAGGLYLSAASVLGPFVFMLTTIPTVVKYYDNFMSVKYGGKEMQKRSWYIEKFNLQRILSIPVTNVVPL